MEDHTHPSTHRTIIRERGVAHIARQWGAESGVRGAHDVAGSRRHTMKAQQAGTWTSACCRPRKEGLRSASL